jgi:hypothetical protein
MIEDFDLIFDARDRVDRPTCLLTHELEPHELFPSPVPQDAFFFKTIIEAKAPLSW